MVNHCRLVVGPGVALAAIVAGVVFALGVQPLGGEGLSGTGPHYLLKFTAERTLTVNTTAAGGNASLLTLGE